MIESQKPKTSKFISKCLCLVMPQPVYTNAVDGINNTEDNEEDLETPTGENIFPTAKVGKVFNGAHLLLYLHILLSLLLNLQFNS